MSDNGTDKALPDDDNVASPPSSEPDMDDQLQSSDPPEEEKSSEDPPSLDHKFARCSILIKQLIKEITSDLSLVKFNPEEDSDPNESNLRLRIIAARLPRIQTRLDQLQTLEREYEALSDDLTGDTTAMLEVEHLVTRFIQAKEGLMQRLSTRSTLRDELFPIPVNNAPSTSMAVYHAQSADEYNAVKHVGLKFNGDKSHKDCLKLFNSWRAAWDLAHDNLKTLHGYSPQVAFKHLKSILEGEALNKIGHLNPRSDGAYQAAMAKLESLYADRLSLAAHYLTSLNEISEDDFVLADAFEDSLVGLENMEETFVEERVHPFQFSILLHFRTHMNNRPAMTESWLDFKERRRQEYLADQIKTGSNKKWHAGLVENSTSFKAWLDVFRATRDAPKTANPIVDRGNVGNPPTSHGFMTQQQPITSPRKSCLVCKADHRYTHCPIALSKSEHEWKQLCKRLNKCHRCTNPWSSTHSCSTVCYFCKGPHNNVVCPNNGFRKERNRGLKRPRSLSRPTTHSSSKTNRRQTQHPERDTRRNKPQGAPANFDKTDSPRKVDKPSVASEPPVENQEMFRKFATFVNSLNPYHGKN
ncbi:uncharacterized protein LOC131891664 [Tigriopus californicus]|uniref:uncharacterized protein LOC131891664 n=1 Tax=Tigriopus californicus TaxID=6832 RepID=UPI0027DA79ED|nr:uncharacterized protein LOC131891664 [Tigriopus californicus]